MERYIPSSERPSLPTKIIVPRKMSITTEEIKTFNDKIDQMNLWSLNQLSRYEGISHTKEDKHMEEVTKISVQYQNT